jgi:hypothetical protein
LRIHATYCKHAYHHRQTDVPDSASAALLIIHGSYILVAYSG